MNLEQFIQTLKAQKKVIFWAMGLTIAMALIVSLVMPKTYTASAAVVIDVNYADPIQGLILPALTQPGYMATQLDIMLSDRVATSVVKTLKLDEGPDAESDWKQATDGRGSITNWYAEQLQKKLDAKPSKDSNVITLTFKSKNPERSAAVVNAFAKAYIETVLELRVEPARRYASWFEERSKATREQLEKAQAALSAYQREKGLIVTNDERYNIESTRLAELSTQLSTIQAARAETRSREIQAKSRGGSTQEVLQNPLVQSIKVDLARQEAKLSELAMSLGVNHPAYKSTAGDVASLRQRLNAEIGQITAGATTNDRINEAREADVKVSLDAQRQRVLDLSKQRDVLTVLQRDVDAAQRAWDAVSQRQTQSNLESQTSQTNISILNAATVPVDPSSPKLLLNLAVAIVAGAVFGIGGAFLLELTDRRVRSISDLREFLDLPMLGALSGGARVRRRLGIRRMLPGRAKLPQLASD